MHGTYNPDQFVDKVKSFQQVQPDPTAEALEKLMRASPLKSYTRTCALKQLVSYASPPHVLLFSQVCMLYSTHDYA